jgi:fumarate reductase flavoprotein subunit
VVIATGGAGRVFRENTNGGVVTGDGMALAYRHGVPLRDMEFVQYHPTCMPGTGLLFTEACRGEGGFLVNKDGYRYLQDYGLGRPNRRRATRRWNSARATASARPSGTSSRRAAPSRARTARWSTSTCATSAKPSCASVCRRSTNWPKVHGRRPGASAPIPVRPAVHYTMGGIKVDGRCAAPLPGLYAIGECSSVGIHGANRLGSNSLTELLVFGKVAGVEAASFAKVGARREFGEPAQAGAGGRAARHGPEDENRRQRTHRHAAQGNGADDGRRLRHLPPGRNDAEDLRQARRAQGALQERQSRGQVERLEHRVAAGHRTRVPARRGADDGVFGDQRRESRGAHQRLDGFEQRDDVNFLKHSQAHYVAGGAPRIDYGPVKITKSQPGTRAYGAAGEKAEQERKASHV